MFADQHQHGELDLRKLGPQVQFGECGTGGDEMFAIVNNQQQPLISKNSDELFKPIGLTGENLKAAIASEPHEYTDMFPGTARAARQEGFDEIADWFETLAKAGKSHAGRFQKALDAL